MPKRYELTPEQWRRIAPLLPGKLGDPSWSGGDNLLFVNSALRVLRASAHWCDLSKCFGKWKAAHKCFNRCARSNVWERVFAG